MGLAKLVQFQLGLESVKGTSVAATSKLSGLYQLTQHEMRTKVRPEELRGTLAQFYRTVTTGTIAQLALTGTATFEDLPYFLAMGIKASTVAVSDAGTPPAYPHLYTPTLTAEDAIDAYTAEYGIAGEQVWKSEYCFVQDFELTAQVDGLTEIKANIMGRQRTATTFTGALSQRTTEDILANLWKVYIDDSGGTLGSTQFGGCIVSLSYKRQCRKAHKCLNGTLFFENEHQVPIAPELDITVEVDSSSLALLSKFTADTRLLIRLQNSSATAIHTSVFPRVRIDGAYNLFDWGPIGAADRDGIQTVALQFRSEYDPTASLADKYEVVNSLAALP